VLLNLYVEQDKARKLAQEQQRAGYSDAVARGNLIAAQQSAKETKWAAGAAVAAAVGAICQLIVAFIGLIHSLHT
jgi:hypothetical protein